MGRIVWLKPSAGKHWPENKEAERKGAERMYGKWEGESWQVQLGTERNSSREAGF